MKIGKYSVLNSTTFLVPHGESVHFTHTIREGDELNCILTVENDSDVYSESKATISTSFDSGLFTITFRNFNNALGSHTKTPIEFALSNNDESIVFLAVVARMAALTRIEFQLMMEERS